jgi:response regulator RpfG family c-di-GMP phosphodiesterase
VTEPTPPEVPDLLVTPADLAAWLPDVTTAELDGDEFTLKVLWGVSILVRDAGSAAWTRATAPERALLIAQIVAKNYYEHPTGVIADTTGPISERYIDAVVHSMELMPEQIEVLERLAQAAEFRDAGTGAHVSRIGALAEQLALALGMSDDEAELLRHAAPLHDVGKVGIPDRILLKPGALEPDEWLVMQSHTLIGARILSGSDSRVVQLAEEIALTHHERWDGGGYPNRLRGEQIPLSGRICAVVDVFDALRSERPYKPAWSLADTLEELRRQRGRHFDPRVLDAFMAIVPELGEDDAEPRVMMAA